MKKTALFIILIAVIFFSCNKNKEKISTGAVTQTENNSIYEQNVLSEKTPAQETYPKEEKGFYGMICFTNILENDVDVMALPSFKADKVFQIQKDTIVEIRGFSNEISILDDYDGNWINILYKKNDNEYVEGWVFSEYINFGDINPSPIKFVEFVEDEKYGSTSIKISYVFNKHEFTKDVSYTDYLDNIYYFIRGPYEHGYHYSNIPGIYTLNKDTLELKHITYSGAFEGAGGHASMEFSSDFKYLAQDSGTSAGIRGVTVWRLSDNKKVFSGLYYDYYRLLGNTIDIIHVYDDQADQDIKSYGKTFTENNPIPPDIEEGQKQGLYVEVIIKCRLNLETGKQEILGGEYILTQ